MKSWVIAIACMAVAVAPASAQEAEVGEAYLAQLTRMWAQDATRDDVAELGPLLSVDATYAHPRVGAEISGRDAIVGAMGSFLGATREPRLTNAEFVVGEGIVVIGFDVAMETNGSDGWRPIQRRQVIVLRVVDGLIVRIEDYW